MKAMMVGKKFVLSILLLIVIVLGLSQVLPGQSPLLHKTKAVPKHGKPFLADRTAAQIEDLIAKMTGGMMLRLAKAYGITWVKGKDVSKPSLPEKASSNRTFLGDRPVSADPSLSEMNPSLAVRPSSSDIIVSAYYDDFSGLSKTKTSKDRGSTWSVTQTLPARLAGDHTMRPVVRYAPNSSYVYAVYLSVRSDLSASDVMITRSNNNGATWQTPKVVFAAGDYDGDGFNDMLDACWVDVHTYPNTSSARSYAYVTATVIEHDGGSRVLFRRVLSYGLTVDAAFTYASVDSPALVQGARAVGGLGGDVLIVYWFAASGVSSTSDFLIRYASSANFGLSFPNVGDAVQTVFQLPQFLGPNGAYHSWWQGMWPSVAMTTSGVAYVTYAYDPEVGSDTDEDGDIAAIRSPRPYTSWTPQEVIFEEHAQGFPTVATKKTAGGCFLMLAWEDHHLSTAGDNELYDIYGFYPETGIWSHPALFRINEFSSHSSDLFVGDHIDSGASALTTERIIQVIWTDRSDKATTTDHETDVYSDLVEIK